jgi:uncharacterized protein (UPF0212 family)
MEIEYHECPMCNKKIKCKTWIARTGSLKGYKIIDIWVHKGCKRMFYKKLSK